MADDPRKQHLISKVLLRRFTSSLHGGQLRSFDLVHGRPHLRHPSAVAWRQDFIEHAPAEAEAMWRRVEDRLDTALNAVEAGTVFNHPDAAMTLRAAIAMHFMRRDLIKGVFTQSFARARSRIRVPEQLQHRKKEFAQEIETRLDADRAELFAANARSLFEQAEELVAHSRLEVVHSPDVPLLIGDGAVLSIRADGGVGFLPFSDAGTHVLPVGRHHLIALAAEDRLLELPGRWAQDLNERQVINAGCHVFFSPEDDLEPFVHQIRDRHRARCLP